MSKIQIVDYTTMNLKQRCFNCKHSSYGFKIAGKTHHQCTHPKHKEGLKKGEITAWDTLQEWYNTCNSHEFRTPIAKKNLI